MTTALNRRPGITIDPWDPGYATSLTVEALAELDATTAELDLDVEQPAEQWKPISPDMSIALPSVLLIADGVRRIEARVWVDDSVGAMPVPGIAASYAAGLIRCAPGNGALATVADVGVRRSLFTPSPHAGDIRTRAGEYTAWRSADATAEALSLALQRQLTDLEIDVATRYRATGSDDDLLIVDGPLRGRTHLPRTVGYIKTHHTAYLSGSQAAVLASLAPGQRTPVFLMGTSWQRYAWYLRLPTGSPVPWAGIVRCEAGPDLSRRAVIEVAQTTARVLPPLAGIDYKDPRAPQNLIPIGGLEKLLRHRLGDEGLLYRALRVAAAGR